MLNWLYGWNLLSGPVPVVSVLLGVGALSFLVVRRSRRWWLHALASAILAAVLAYAAGWAVINVWYWWPEALPATVIACLGVALWALFLALPTAFAGLGAWLRRRPVARKTSVRRRVLALVAGMVVVGAASMQVNAYFGEYPTLGSLVRTQAALPEGIPHFLQKKDADRFMETPVAQRWNEPRALPATGEMRSVQIPGKMSGFHGRNAVVYLPPAYFAPHRPLLPVVVLVSGQPGSPMSWLQSTGLRGDLDAYAQAHRGLAPVVVMPDPNGAEQTNTMCMNSQIAQADTYMAVDVPGWITDHLDVDTNHAHWAVAGFSYGGTCAVQMVTRHPHIYQTFAAFSPEREPALTANRSLTVQRAFNGDTAAFNALLPLTLMAHHRYPEIHGWFASGQLDPVYTANVHTLATAARKAGMTVATTTFPGGHSWAMVSEGLPEALNFLGNRLGTQ